MFNRFTSKFSYMYNFNYYFGGMFGFIGYMMFIIIKENGCVTILRNILIFVLSISFISLQTYMVLPYIDIKMDNGRGKNLGYCIEGSVPSCAIAGLINFGIDAIIFGFTICLKETYKKCRQYEESINTLV